MTRTGNVLSPTIDDGDLTCDHNAPILHQEKNPIPILGPVHQERLIPVDRKMILFLG